jgi:hypothetical protein
MTVLDTIFEVNGYSKLHETTTPKTTRTDSWYCVLFKKKTVLDTIFEVNSYSKLNKTNTPKTTRTDGWDYVLFYNIYYSAVNYSALTIASTIPKPARSPDIMAALSEPFSCVSPAKKMVAVNFVAEGLIS